MEKKTLYYAINKVTTESNSPTTVIFGMDLPIAQEFINSYYLIDGFLVNEYGSRKFEDMEKNYFLTTSEEEAIKFKKQLIMDNNVMIMNELNNQLIGRIDEVYVNKSPDLANLHEIEKGK